MNDFNPLLVSIWREVCRHLDIADSARTLGQLLTLYLPLEQLLVQQLDPQRGYLQLLAEGPDRRRPGGEAARITCRPAQIQRLLAAAHAGEILHRLPGEKLPGDLELLIPPDLRGEVLVGPLLTESGTAGFLLLRAQPFSPFEPDHRRLAGALLEPFSVALENDQRLREIQALREAAEAEKRSLLTRLGREDLTGQIVGVDSGLQPVMERVQLVAPADIPVLILGETGTGKEVIARTIHDHSPRAKAPFIRVNCGAIPPDLIDSELFGHEKGSFTGATGSRRGWFERADEGTLLLDEVGELPLPAQVRLLRVLQEGSFERVGGEKPIHVNVRIIAATHRDLPAMVQHKQFREDLWYRIAGFPIVLPPLRERQEDIAALATHFAQRAARRFGLRPHAPTPADLQLLTRYPWPGNIRELASVIDRATILGGGRFLAVSQALGSDPAAEHDPHPVTRAQGLAAGPTVVPGPPPAANHPRAMDPTLSLDAAMSQHIAAVLGLTGGRIEGPRGAADRLGINPHTLRARMRKLGLDWRPFRR